MAVPTTDSDEVMSEEFDEEREDTSNFTGTFEHSHELADIDDDLHVIEEDLENEHLHSAEKDK